MRTAPIRSPESRDPSAVLFGKTRRLILGWLLGHPDEEYYLRRLVRQTGAAQGAVQRELEALARAGLVTRRADGRQVYFRANRESPIFPELRSIFEKTVGLTEVLRGSLSAHADRIRAAFVFGSAARGELRDRSDVDLLIVGDVPFPEVVDALSGAQERLGRDINPTVYPPAEFGDKLRRGDHFLSTVLKEPRLLVIGDSDELEGLGAERLVAGASNERRRDPRSPGGGRARSGRQRR